MTSPWRLSPQDVDPVSWFTGPRIPILFSLAGVIEGLLITVLYWDRWSNIPLQFVGLALFLTAGWLTASGGRPHRPRFGLARSSGILLVGCAGVVSSGLGTIGGTLPVEQWWPNIALGVIIVVISPYCTPRNLLISSIPVVVFSGVLGLLVFSGSQDFWPPVTVFLLGAGPTTIGAAAGIVFSYTVVSRTQAMLDTAAGVEEFYPSVEPLGDEEQRDRIARLSARIAPFVERIARSGVITDADRGLAAQIARRLRSELLLESDKSWLDVVAHKSGMIVSDPARMADRMNESQRAALQGLLVAAMESSVVDSQTLLIELRAQSDGSTAVALSIDVDLPEGRRLVLLAPYYLTLKTTVEDLSWDDGRSLLMRFRIPPS
jgi:hypothetical protein